MEYKQNSKCLPGWEMYQSREEQQKLERETLGFYNPMAFDPSGQEATMVSRTASKMSEEEKRRLLVSPNCVAAGTDVWMPLFSLHH